MAIMELETKRLRAPPHSTQSVCGLKRQCDGVASDVVKLSRAVRNYWWNQGEYGADVSKTKASALAANTRNARG